MAISRSIAPTIPLPPSTAIQNQYEPKPNRRKPVIGLDKLGFENFFPIPDGWRLIQTKFPLHFAGGLSCREYMRTATNPQNQITGYKAV